MPWVYYPEEPDDFIASINRTIDAYAEAREVTISEHSRALILNTFTAIIEDPSPYWFGPDDLRFQHLRELTEQLPAFLTDLEETELQDVDRTARRLSYFQTLHWLERNLDGVCPFQKER